MYILCQYMGILVFCNYGNESKVKQCLIVRSTIKNIFVCFHVCFHMSQRIPLCLLPIHVLLVLWYCVTIWEELKSQFDFDLVILTIFAHHYLLKVCHTHYWEWNCTTLLIVGSKISSINLKFFLVISLSLKKMFYCDAQYLIVCNDKMKTLTIENVLIKLHIMLKYFVWCVVLYLSIFMFPFTKYFTASTY